MKTESIRSSLQEPLLGSSIKPSKCCRIKLNSNVSRLNFAAYCISNCIAVIIMISSTVLFALLVQNPSYFGLQKNAKAEVVGSATLYSSLVALLVSQIGGILYDLIGRRILIIICSALASLSILAMPFCPNIYPSLILCKIVAINSALIIVYQPVLIDYIDRDSRGLASAFTNIIKALIRIFILQIELSSYVPFSFLSIYIIHGTVCLLLTLFLIFYLIDVRSQLHQPASQKNCSSSLRSVCLECAKVTILIGLLGGFVKQAGTVLTSQFVSTYFSIWVFPDNPEFTRQKVHSINGYGSIITLVLYFIFGILVDKLNFKKIQAPLFTIIGIILILIYYHSCMNCAFTSFLLVCTDSLILSSNVVIIQLIAKSVEGRMKGTVMGFYSFSIQLGSVVFSLIGKELLKQEDTSKDIFLGVAILMFTVAICSLISFKFC